MAPRRGEFAVRARGARRFRDDELTDSAAG
jgi:hypothetical protein